MNIVLLDQPVSLFRAFTSAPTLDGAFHSSFIRVHSPSESLILPSMVHSSNVVYICYPDYII